MTPRRSRPSHRIGLAAIAGLVLALAVWAPAAAWALARPVSIDNVARSLAPLPIERSRPVVVGAADRAALPRLADTVRALGGEVVATHRFGALSVRPPAGGDAAAFAGRLRELAGVAYAMPERTLRATAAPNDQYFDVQWGLQRIGAPAAWSIGTGSGVTIAILDTGIDPANPDFIGKVVAGANFTSANSAAWGDDNGHGTHVAGIAAAAANNIYGIAGTAPGARLLVAKTLNASGLGSESTVANGIYWAVDRGAQIISMSFDTTEGTPGTVDPLGKAVDYARSHGCVLVAAAGNTGGPDRVWPAAYPGVIAVAATDDLDRRAAFSTYGTRPDGSSTAIIAAPGVDILSYYWPAGRLVRLSGTSMATPFVSGAAAVIVGAHPTWDAGLVTAALTGSAIDVPPAGRDVWTGYGVLRLDLATGRPMTPDTFESDDTTAQAITGPRLLNVSTVVTSEWHDFVPSGETDVACIDLIAGRTYQLWTSDPTGGADTVLSLVATDGVTTIATSDDAVAGATWSYLRVTAAESGRHFLVVTDPRARGGAYVLNAVRERLSTTLSIRANTSRPRYRRYFTLSGALTPSMAGSAVTLQVLRPGTRRWTSVATVGTHGATVGGGTSWSKRYRPTRRGTYKFRVRFAGDAEHLATTSGILTRRVR